VGSSGMHSERRSSIFLGLLQKRDTFQRSSRAVEVRSIAAASESGANKTLKSYPQGTAFESRISAALVCPKSTRKISGVVCWVCGGIGDEWK
jgi:hypothetical protein